MLTRMRNMKKIYYNKLIRDKIPEIIREKGSDCKTKTLSSVDFYKELVKKVSEEASGILGAKNKKELISEIADVLDVINEIKKVKKITSKQILRTQEENNKRKGGFKKHIYLFWSSDDGYKTNEKRYSKQ